jgi:hypothetical protein
LEIALATTQTGTSPMSNREPTPAAAEVIAAIASATPTRPARAAPDRPPAPNTSR